MAGEAKEGTPVQVLAAVYTLFIVTYGADVKTSQHATLRECQEAESVARTGMTLEAKAKADAEEARRFEAEKEADAKFQADYPPHTITEAEKAEVLRVYVSGGPHDAQDPWKNGHWGMPNDKDGNWRYVENGVVHTERRFAGVTGTIPYRGVSTMDGQTIYLGNGSLQVATTSSATIKYSVCAMVAP